MIAQQISFDRDRIFYPHVLFFLMQLRGSLDTLFRGALRGVENDRSEENLSKIFDDSTLIRLAKSADLKKFQDIQFILKSSCNSKKLDFDAEIVVDMLYSYIEASGLSEEILMKYQFMALGQLIINTFDSLKALGRIDIKGDEILCFLYHCRNGCAHGGKFNITTEKYYPAKWSLFEINDDSKGKGVFRPSSGQVESDGLITIGDAIALIWDIEQKYGDQLNAPVVA